MCTVVYNAAPGFPALELVEFLVARGLTPQTLDDPNPDPALLYASAHSYIVRIAVPLKSLREREAGRQVLVERAAAQLRWQVTLGTLVSIFVAACILLAGGGPAFYTLEDFLTIGVGVALGAIIATVVIAQITERLTRQGAPNVPQCDACGYILLGLTEPRCPECGYPFSPTLLRSDKDLGGEVQADELDEPV
jgi:hypothetical protein